MPPVPAARAVRARRMSLALALGLTVACGPRAHAADGPPAPAAASSVDCHVGLHALADGRLVDIGPSDGSALRWRLADGTTGLFHPGGDGASTGGWTDRPDGHHVHLGDCATGRLEFDGQPARRLALPTRETRFTADDGVTLVGRLVMPPGNARVPIVVLLHGSEHDSALRFNSLQRRFPGEGIGAFVYDKRGTGESGGRYTQDFELLARDAVAAAREARRLAGARAGRIGYQGPSQGGWVAPLAALRMPVDYVLVTFGLAVSVLDEDRQAVALDVQSHGYGPEVMGPALALADACAVFALNPGPEAFDRFAATRDRYRHEPWFRDIHGDFCFLLLGLEKSQLPSLEPHLHDATPWTWDPMSTIASVAVPQLWILAQDDRDAPSAETARRLRLLREAGHPIATAMWPRTEHGIFEFETRPDGERRSTRNPDGYLRLMTDFIRGVPLAPPYGDALLELPRP